MMKPKTNREGDMGKSLGYDQCQTPYYALDPLTPFLSPDWLFWESAAGDGQILGKMRLDGFEIFGSDILTGANFFTYEPGCHWDCQITNPPYSVKYEWLSRSYELQKPFALLLPLETLGAAKGQRLFRRFGLEVILLSRRINFKMPDKGYTGGGAQFPVAWFTWGLNLGSDLIFGDVVYYEDGQLDFFSSIAECENEGA